MKLHIATCKPLPEPDVDEDLLLEALAGVGVDACMVPWRDESAFAPAVPTLIRSTWDYIHHVAEFSAWVERRSAAPLWNPASVVRGNLHKEYLLDLAKQGVPVTPTVLVTRGSERSLLDIAMTTGWRELVVKPAVGAGSFETHRVRVADEIDEYDYRRLLTERDLLVQRYLPSVEDHGERALVWIAGEFTHAVRKSPRFAGGSESVSAAMGISAAERKLGEAIIATLPADLLYARVDLAPNEHGEPVLMELELVEPSLFLLQEPRALRRLANAIRDRLAVL